MDTAIFIRSELARSEMYKRLATCYQPPDDTLGATLEGLEANAAAMSSGACDHVSLMRTEFQRIGVIQELQVEHARLFVGPYQTPAAPYGSIYLESGRTIMGQSTMNAIAQYRSADLTVSDDFKDAPDHISVEMEFMYAVILRAVEAIGRDDVNAFQHQLTCQRSFLTYHLAAWVPAFAEAVDTHAAMAFYRHLATATRMFIAEECDALRAWIQADAAV